MANNFGTNEARNLNFEPDGPNPTRSSSPDQLAMVWNGQGEVVVALPVASKTPGTFDLDLVRLPANQNLSNAIRTRRGAGSTAHPVSGSTYISTVVPDYSERTRILALDGQALALDDDDLAEWLLSAEKQISLGTDNFPIFESALDDTACSILRLPNGQISMTEVPRQHVSKTRERIEMMLGEEVDSYLANFTVETPLRCVARYFLNALPQGLSVRRKGKELEVTTFLLITRFGFSFGLWSPTDGLFSEYAFLAPSEIQNLSNSDLKAVFDQKVDPKSPIDSAKTVDQRSDPTLPVIKDYVRRAFEQLNVQLSPERLEQMKLSCYAQVVWSAEPGFSSIIRPIASEYSTKTGLDVFQIEIPSDEAIASGLLLGSFDFGDENSKIDETVPQINLARDLLVLADRGETRRQNVKDVMARKRHDQAVFALLAAPVLALAVLLGLIVNFIRAETWLVIRGARAESHTLELKSALDRRIAYEAKLKWYQEFITQVSRLRRQQPVSIGLQRELDSRFPLEMDPSFYVSDMRLLVNGTFEVKGLAQNKDALTEFLKALEFAGGTASGTRVFGNLTYEVQEGVPASAAGQTGVPNPGKTQLVSNLAPGVIAWSIKGNYLPMAEFIPPDPNKKPVPNATPVPGQPTVIAPAK